MTAADTLRPEPPGSASARRRSTTGRRRSTTARRRPAAPGPGETRHSPLTARRKKLFWPLLLPAALVYVVFFAGPSLFTLWLSLNKWAARAR